MTNSKVTFSRNGIIAIESAKSYKPVGFFRKDGKYYQADIFKIVDGCAEYNSGSNNRTHAMIAGTSLLELTRKEISKKVASLYEASFEAA